MALTGTSSAGPVEERKQAPAAVIDLRDIFVIVKRQVKWVFWSALSTSTFTIWPTLTTSLGSLI